MSAGPNEKSYWAREAISWRDYLLLLFHLGMLLAWSRFLIVDAGEEMMTGLPLFPTWLVFVGVGVAAHHAISFLVILLDYIRERK
jgi:hypothetical protein